jgi:hypothetical protein
MQKLAQRLLAVNWLFVTLPTSYLLPRLVLVVSG